MKKEMKNIPQRQPRQQLLEKTEIATNETTTKKCDTNTTSYDQLFLPIFGGNRGESN